MKIKTLKLSLILEGWANKIKDEFHILNPEIKKLATERMLKCNTCAIRVGNNCHSDNYGVHVKTGKTINGCGCNISAKTLVPQAECPLGYW